MIDGPFANNTTVKLVHTDSAGVNHVAGFVFASPGSGSISQEQRWVLYDGYMPLETDFILKQPHREDLQFSELAAWQDAVNKGTGGPLWQDRATYVKVWCARYSYIADPVQPPPPIPRITLRTLGVTASSSGKRQIEDRWTIIQSTVRTGELYGTKIGWSGGLSTNYEYWVTLPAYRLPVVVDPETKLLPAYASSPDDFLRAMRDEMSRNPGSTFTIASCAYLNGLPEDP